MPCPPAETRLDIKGRARPYGEHARDPARPSGAPPAVQPHAGERTAATAFNKKERNRPVRRQRGIVSPVSASQPPQKAGDSHDLNRQTVGPGNSPHNR